MDAKRRTETATLAVIVTVVMMVTSGDALQDVILKTNYEYSIKTLQPKIFFTTNQARIVLHLKVPDTRVEDLTPEQIAEEQNVTRRPCLGLDRPRNLYDTINHPECENILSLVRTIFDLRHKDRFFDAD